MLDVNDLPMCKAGPRATQNVYMLADWLGLVEKSMEALTSKPCVYSLSGKKFSY